MGAKRADIVEQQRSHAEMFDHLYKRFDTYNKKDFSFVIKNLAKELGWDSYKVLAVLRKFMEYGIVEITKQRSSRDLWRTRFEKRNKEEILNEIL